MTGPTVGRIRQRSTFRELRRPMGRGARGPVRVAYLPAPADGQGEFPQVAYAIGRRSGNAVERNRLRRRLRAAVRVAVTGTPAGPGGPGATGLPEVAGGRYLISADPMAATLAFGELTRVVAEAMAAAAAGPARRATRTRGATR